MQKHFEGELTMVADVQEEFQGLHTGQSEGESCWRCQSCVGSLHLQGLVEKK